MGRGVSGESTGARHHAATYTRVMADLKPDTTGLAAIHEQPEFNEQVWQYLNRRVSDWRIITGRQKAQEYAALLARIEHDYGVAPSVMLGVWGMEFDLRRPARPEEPHAAGDPVARDARLGRAAPPRLLGGELLNALVIQSGWSTPAEMNGSWAGAMGHTQWMPEVWLHIGVDYDGDGHISPFGPPDDALATTARYFVERGNYRRGEPWGYEVRAPDKVGGKKSRRYAEWQKLGVAPRRRAGLPAARRHCQALGAGAGRAGLPARPEFLCRAHLQSVDQLHARDRPSRRPRIGGEAFVQSFPGSERAPTLAEVQEIQRRLTALGFDTGGTDGRVGNDTMLAVRDFQRKVGMKPADGYAGIKVLARLRQGA